MIVIQCYAATFTVELAEMQYFGHGNHINF